MQGRRPTPRHLENSMLNNLTYLYGFNLGFAHRLVRDLSDEQMTAQPAGVINHPAWSLGHLAVAADHLGMALGLESHLPEGWDETFKTGGEPSGDASAFPTKEEIIGELEAQHARNTEAVQNFDVARFAEEHPNEGTRKYFPTLGDQIIFMMTSHEMDHLGQIAAWRRAMGLGAATSA
ncbi:MAG TPA: DinB family protein [Gemmatimonadetes bacterium]|nr:DinB family protein [Gemmatimonadota bacterium]